MKLWKFAAIGLILCGAVLLQFVLKAAPSSRVRSPSSPSSSSMMDTNSSASSGAQGRLRRARSTDGGDSLVSELMEVFQSFTEGELKQVIGALVEKKAHRDALQSKRTKRAKKGAKPCSLRMVEVTVSQLDLGFDSDETIAFHYCSGKCTFSRKNYDVVLAHMKKSGLLLKDQRDKARHSPCCRPTTYEDDFLFLDNSFQYRTIREFSAKDCGCV
ncbi:hypothetical protein DNTS_015157 [Danionella cerebrum]|uniref:TGF-beta family profile domain-containing protein n=1 Tax=Danionella cerebrum TaxID=2873325 RepID=A0A553RGX3_9TELE|nr:hypothetical protein DNTS_015157 [Danionella translucida]